MAKADDARPDADYIESVKAPGNYNTLKRLKNFCQMAKTEDEIIEYLLSVSKYERQAEWSDRRNRRYERVKYCNGEFEVSHNEKKLK